MKSMTLLKAMSELPPQDIDAAMQAGAGGKAVRQPDSGETEPGGHGRVIIRTAQPKAAAGRHFRIGGWAAAAACLTLTVGAVMLFHRDNSDLVLMHSASDQIAEETVPAVTGTTAAESAAQTAAKQTVTGENSAVTVYTTVVTESVENADGTKAAQTEAQTELTAAPQQTEPAETTTVPAVTYPAEIPVLIAMADDAGTLPQEYTDGKPEWSLIEGADAVSAYLNSPSPVVTLGEGQKSAAVSAAIMQNPAMYRIRWKKQSHMWNSYGIRAAEIDADGVLHLEIAMYADGGTYEEAEWIYETALLFEAGTMPQITDVRLDLTYFEDTDGIGQWLAYQAALAEDVNVHNNK